MSSLPTLVPLAVITFATTNIDDVFVLLGFFADPRTRARDVVTGQFLGISFLFVVSVLASLLALVMPEHLIGLLGLAPIFIGARKIYRSNSNPKQSQALRRSIPADVLESSPSLRSPSQTAATTSASTRRSLRHNRVSILL